MAMFNLTSSNSITRHYPEAACGIQPFVTGTKDPLHKACLWHDKAYLRGSKEQIIFSRKEVDDIFLGKMLKLAGDSLIKKAQSYVYYGLVRLFGWMFWEGRR